MVDSWVNLLSIPLTQTLAEISLLGGCRYLKHRAVL